MSGMAFREMEEETKRGGQKTKTILTMSKVQLTGAFARFRGKLNKSESLVFKGKRPEERGLSERVEDSGTGG